ncbi:hypothetical protein L0Y40_02875 [Candidatus Wolfebacteria bacterium]|nr:hypothetical protein [Candidatus Wolfebacteria bacterium]
MLALHFVPIFKDTGLIQAADEYREIWKQGGAAIVQAFEKVSGLSFTEERIGAVVYEGVSFSGRSPNDIMKLRASYPYNTKKATLVHELGHRLLFGIDGKDLNTDSHRMLFLILYDVWVELYGKAFADEQVKVESSRKGLHNYEEAWRWVLSLTREKRLKMFRDISEIKEVSKK